MHLQKLFIHDLLHRMPAQDGKVRLRHQPGLVAYIIMRVVLGQQGVQQDGR
jgi:hypothetical protein